MGFYGHLSNIQKTSMTFDRIYPNRATMDDMADGDGVYAGRYVLIEYENALDQSQLTPVICFDGLLYALPEPRETWDVNDTDPTSPTSYLAKLIPLTVGSDLEENIVGNQIKADITVACVKKNNLIINSDNIIEAGPKTQYFKIATNGTVSKTSYNLLYNYITQNYELDESASQEMKTGCAYNEVLYSSLSVDDTTADKNYRINYAIDEEAYGSARGYDSTVWQKTYVNGHPRYVMIAELNSVVPALDVSADAPTFTPIMPHFSQDSTNIYYKLHMQPTWGFRIKAANPELRLPMLDYNGNKYVGQGSGNIKARHEDHKKYSSDEKISWIKTALNQDGGGYNVTYLSEQDNIGTWQTDNQKKINGAIYYNKAGFDKEIISHSDEIDEIALTPTGYSGHQYPTHESNGIKAVAPDVNELSIMLPSIGNTIADVWDLIYGDDKINNSDKYRNTVIRWEDAKKVQAKDGLRLVNNNSLLGYTYNTDSVNTLAGVINSAQDIIGMIITDDYPVDLEDTEAIEKLNENYIYHLSTDSGNRYYFKKPTYNYTPVDGDNPIEPVELADWEKYKDKVWWKDTNNMEHPDYIQEATYHPDRDYVQGVKVPRNGDKGNPSQFKGAEYQKGKYYIWTDTNSKNDPLVDGTTKAPYHIYYISEDEKRDINKRYLDLKLTKTRLKDKGVYYVPNKYYLGDFVLTTVKDEADFRKKISDGVRLFIGTTLHNDYGLCGDVTELKIDDYSKIGQLPVHYLTLSTCEWSVEEYRQKSKDYSTRPVLFYSDIESALGTPQSYYVINKSYQYFTDKQTIEASPGVYYRLKIEEGKTVSDYVNDNGFLNPNIILTDNDKDKDIYMDEGYMYFREIIELKLADADQVVNIKEAVIVEPENLPNNLYQTYNQDGRVGYRHVTANSSIISTAKNCGDIENLYLLEKAEELVVGYVADSYYYEIKDEGHAQHNSVIIDSRKEPDKDIDYWTPNLINKRKLTAEQVELGRQSGETYYVYNQQDNKYEIYEGAKLDQYGEYYVSSLSDAPEFYSANKYYYQNAAGEYVLDSSESFTEGREYFKNPQLYVIEDPNGFYDKGAIWPLGSNPPTNSGIVLGKREETWMLKELEGFDVSFNTLHGLLLRLNRWMLQNDTLTRDNATLQGALNQLNDLIHRFGKMEAGQLMIVDDAGRMHGVDVQEDNWIDVNINSNYTNPSINVAHKFTKVSNTTSASNLNTSKGDTINLYTPKVDDKGHVVGNNIETVTLPYGYKTFKEDGFGNTTSATSTQSTMTLIGDDYLEPVVNNNTIGFIHNKVLYDPFNTKTIIMDNQAGDNRNVIGPFIEEISFDPAGHVTDKAYISYQLPNSYQTFMDDNDNSSTATNTHDTLYIEGDEWIKPIVSQGNLTLTHINNSTSGTFYTFGNQTPKFGEPFNLMAPTIDTNGHLIASRTETVTLPTSITGLIVNEGLPANGPYLSNGITLVSALNTLQQSLKEESTQLLEKITNNSNTMVTRNSTFKYGNSELTIENLAAKVKELEDKINTLTPT